MEDATNTATAGAPPRDYPAIDAICLEIKRVLRSMEPSAEVCAHFRNARIEMLKGFRAIIDHRIEHLSRSEQSGQKITVE